MKTNNKADKFITWKKSPVGLIITAVIELVLAYIVISRAVDTGSWWEYLITFVLALGAVSSIMKVLTRKK